MVQKTDTRQLRYNDSGVSPDLDQVTTTVDKQLDNLLRSINSELTQPLRLTPNSTPNLIVNVGNITVTNPETSRSRTVPPISNTTPAFTTGTITFPAATGGNIVPSSGATVALVCPSGQFTRVGISLNAAGQLTITQGTAGAPFAAATAAPTPSSALPIGFIAVHNTGGTIDNITDAMIYTFGSGGGGSGGDSSLELQSIASSSLTLSGGFIHLSDGRQIGTYDGVGTSESDYSKDISVNLTTILGSSPIDGTTYYLYLDLDLLGFSVVLTDSGRKVYSLAATDTSKFLLSTSTPDQVNKGRYRVLGLVRSATTGNSWTGIGSTFKSWSTKLHDVTPNAVLPIAYRLPKQVIGTPGSTGQIAMGHVLDARSFRTTLTGSTLSIYKLRNDANDSNGTRHLTNDNTALFTGTNILGEVNKAANLNGTNQRFRVTDAFFNVGDSDFFACVRVKTASWTSGSDVIMSQLLSGVGAVGNPGWQLQKNANNVKLSVPDSTTTTAIIYTIDTSTYSASSWHSFMVAYRASDNQWFLYIDGALAASGNTSFANITQTSGIFVLGADEYTSPTGSACWTGEMEDAAFGLIFPDAEEARRYHAYRIDHNAVVLPEKQKWSATVFSRTATEDNTSWLVDKVDSNSTFVDFFNQSLTDSVELWMEDLGLSSALVVQNTSGGPFDTTYTSDPTFPIAHGQSSDIPAVRIDYRDATTLKWSSTTGEGRITTDSTNLNGSVTDLFTGGADRVRIIAAAPGKIDAAVGVRQATATAPGLIPYLNYVSFTTIKTGAYTAVKGDHIPTDSSGGAFTVTLPAGAAFGDVIEVYDATGSWTAFNVTIDKNGHNINGSASNYSCNLAGKAVKFVYISVAQGWRAYPYG